MGYLHSVELNRRSANVVGEVNDKFEEQPGEARSLLHNKAKESSRLSRGQETEDSLWKDLRNYSLLLGTRASNIYQPYRTSSVTLLTSKR